MHHRGGARSLAQLRAAWQSFAVLLEEKGVADSVESDTCANSAITEPTTGRKGQGTDKLN